MKISVSLFAALVLVAPLASAQEKPRIQAYYIPSGSMEPTLNVNDRVLTSTLPYQKGNPKHGELVITELRTAEVAPWADDKSKTVEFVMRVVAVPGDRVEIVKRVLWLNGKAQKEPFTKWESFYSYDMKVVKGLVYSREYTQDGLPGYWTRRGEIIPEKQQSTITRAKSEVLPARKYLMLGDHRSNSNDSHVFGLVDRAVLKAKVTMRMFPSPRTF
ncbi:signal peptidase I [bacterium]|nr:MAG: signal peptidase I [bacterium]